MQIRWNSILNDSWEIIPNRILVGRSLGMVGESVSVFVSLLSLPVVALFRLGRAVVRAGSFQKDFSFSSKRLKQLTHFVPLLFFLDSRSRDKPCAIVVVARLRYSAGGA